MQVEIIVYTVKIQVFFAVANRSYVMNFFRIIKVRPIFCCVSRGSKQFLIINVSVS